MNVNWRPWRRERGLDHELRANRPEPRPDFVQSLAERVREDRRRSWFGARPRLAFAGALTVVMLAVVGGFGGFGYAATAAKQAAKAVTSFLTASGDSEAIEVRGLTASGDQYQAGYGWGDPAHNHEGSPGLKRKGGALAPPLVASCTGVSARVTASIVLDEQAVLRVSVLGPGGKKLLLTQNGSRVGGELSGPQTKTIRYRVLVPRTIRISLRIPCSVLEDGAAYKIVITATDPDGNVSTLKIPFRALNLTT
jgi:hypothetical protein